MYQIPHDSSDLMLAPVVLAINERLERLSKLSLPELATEVALVGNVPDWTHGLREDGLVATVKEGIECHGWELSWETRGLCLAHGTRSIVLGVPANLSAYLAGDHRPARVL